MISYQEAEKRVKQNLCLVCGTPVAPSIAATLTLTLTQPNGDNQCETVYFHHDCFVQLSEALHLFCQAAAEEE